MRTRLASAVLVVSSVIPRLASTQPADACPDRLPLGDDERMGDRAEAAHLLGRDSACADEADAVLVSERMRRLRDTPAALAHPVCPVAAPAGSPVPRLSMPAALRGSLAGPRPGRAWPWLVAGGGALAVALGLAAAADAATLPDCATPERGRACLRAPIDARPVLQSAAVLSAAAGAVTLTAGIALFTGRHGRPRARAWLGPGLFGLALTADL